MFTGLIEEVGKINTITKLSDGMNISVSAQKILNDVNLGDSVAVNGVCLTVVDIKQNSISFDVSEETIKRSNFKYLKIGDYVNLERALKVSDRLGGHIVQGHVDTTGKIITLENKGEHTLLEIEVPEGYEKFVIEKGSIAVDGISLTINYIYGNKLSINIIPHTLENTNLKYRKVGESVNLEFDILGKYVLKFLTNLDLLKLKENRLKELLDGL